MGMDVKGLCHVHVWEHLFLHHFQAGLFDMHWVPGHTHVVDILTKNLKEVNQFNVLRQSIVADGFETNHIPIGAIDWLY